jgi:hypothetical protein
MNATTSSSATKAILLGGFLGGTGDLVFAFAYYGLRLGVFQNVAGGIMGREAARAGGVPTFVLGVGLHYLIAVIWAALFWVLSPRIRTVLQRAIPAGLVYGLVIFYGMNCVVLPLSALHTNPWPPPFAPVPMLAHVGLVGLPIALIAWRFSKT